MVARPQKEVGEGKRAFTRPSTRREAKGPSDGAGCRSRIHRLEGGTIQIEKEEEKGQAGAEAGEIQYTFDSISHYEGARRWVRGGSSILWGPLTLRYDSHPCL